MTPSKGVQQRIEAIRPIALKLYERGLPVKLIAETTDVDPRTINRWAREKGLEVQPRESVRGRVIALAAEGRLAGEISRELNAPSAYVRTVMRETGFSGGC